MTETINRPRWSDLKPNLDVFVATLAHIEEFPEEHNQGPWRCNSGMCFGGWATQVAGFWWKTKTARSANVVMPLNAVPLPEPGGYDIVDRVGTNGLASVYVSNAAQIALGITDTQATTEDGDWLFDATNTLPKLYKISAEILGISPRTLKRKVKKYRQEHRFRNYVKKPHLLSRAIRWRKHHRG